MIKTPYGISSFDKIKSEKYFFVDTTKWFNLNNLRGGLRNQDLGW